MWTPNVSSEGDSDCLRNVSVVLTLMSSRPAAGFLSSHILNTADGFQNVAAHSLFFSTQFCRLSFSFSSKDLKNRSHKVITVFKGEGDVCFLCLSPSNSEHRG